MIEISIILYLYTMVYQPTDGLPHIYIYTMVYHIVVPTWDPQNSTRQLLLDGRLVHLAESLEEFFQRTFLRRHGRHGTVWCCLCVFCRLAISVYHDSLDSEYNVFSNVCFANESKLVGSFSKVHHFRPSVFGVRKQQLLVILVPVFCSSNKHTPW